MTNNNKDKILETLIEVVTRNIGMRREDIDMDAPLDRYGTDSLQWANIAYELSLGLNRRVSPEELASYGSVSGMMIAFSST